MLVLAIDTSTAAVTAAVGRFDDRPGVSVLATRVTVNARAHGELLAPAIETVLAEVGARVADLGAVVVGVGPGPFTGLRVGLVSAAAIADVLEIPTYPVCSLDAFAVGRPGRLLVATDARRREVYWACYADGNRLAGVAVGAPDEVAGRAAGLGVRLAVGDGAQRYAEVLGLPLADEPRYPPPAGLLALGAQRVRAGVAGEPLTPLYLRRPDAVRPGPRKPVLR